MELTAEQRSHVLSRFPKFELSYETVSHKKVSLSVPSVALAIYLGKKAFLWFTFCGDEDVCYLLELNKDKNITRVLRVPIGSVIPRPFHYGTILYATIVEQNANTFYVVEDIYQFQGLQLYVAPIGDRLGFIRDTIQALAFPQSEQSIRVASAVMWYIAPNTDLTDNPVLETAKKMEQCHHIQYREIDRIAPYINIPFTKVTDAPEKPIVVKRDFGQTPRFDYSRPTYRYPAIFSVCADAQYDIYHIFAFSGTAASVYCGIMGIQTYWASVFMNSIFRNIRENVNIDYLEESDDEDDFENVAENKYVDLEKTVLIECVFNPRFKKWEPVRLASPDKRVIHVSQLIVDTRANIPGKYIAPSPQDNRNGYNKNSRPYSQAGYAGNRRQVPPKHV